MATADLLSLLIFLVFTLCSASAENNEPNLGFGLELILTKLEQLELKLVALEQQNQLLVELLNKPCSKVVHKDTTILKQIDPPSSLIVTDELTDENEIYSSCSKVPLAKPGKYLLKPTETSEPFYGFCDENSHGKGWMVIQRRFNGTEIFYRNWTDYKTGFGSLDGEFWFGLDRIHLFTSTRKHEIMFDLMDFKGTSIYAIYKAFLIGSEAEGYAIKELGMFNGNYGDSFEYHKGMKFTTFDRDNDEHKINCAVLHHGAWWYRSCYKSNLNGKYVHGHDFQSMVWSTFQEGQGLQLSKIMIREV
ncbi:microfibril-associated glycoprotein 4-like isoform X1 [Topomyia yanbarensis]|uniref:microfibril-associated glycoprotein 4-like isoform X1 n=1 Tax=Topomyia yanbarensis TaxID=2498891 RepID=UPI00273C8948|nr:microfibril-associated glycoprotein 4-like isoform X1 [Topomyia yanbarensis]